MEFITKTPCGEVKGALVESGIVAYKGIRYATAERFAYPTEVTHWDGVYEATEYGACAYQPRSFYDEERMPKKIFYFNEFRRGREYTYSEDCLFLNVFTPEEGGENMPVILYIHGGGFKGGCAHEKHFDVPSWPKKGVIGVTINYRLGPLGFAVLPELKEEAGKTGNYGLYDQLTAIEWVRHNIASFGGDPNNITIMGQSAGAMSVQQLCLSPLARGKFQKAVMCSGGGVNKMLSASKPEKLYPFWQAVMAEVDARSLDEIRAVSVEQIFAAWDKLKSSTKGGFPSPVIDGELVVAKGHEIVKRGEQHHIPYMIGSTSEDMLPPFLFSMAKKWCARQESDAYLWFFERQLPGDDHGAWHSADLWYWFGTLDKCWRPFEEKDYNLAEEMTDYLTSFAKCGNPNGTKGNGKESENRNVTTEWHSGTTALTLGDNPTAMKNPKALKLWHTMLTNHAPGE